MMNYIPLLIIGMLMPSISGLGDPAFLQYFGTFCMGVSEDFVEMKCPSDSQIVIVKALFGREDDSVCAAPASDSLATTGCDMKDVRSVMEAKCRKQSVCSFTLDENTFPAHCTGVQKYLSVDYDCRYEKKFVRQCQGMDAISTLSCENENHVLRIVDAFWGRRDRSTCPGLSGTSNTNCSQPKIGPYVEQLCQHKKNCTLCPNVWGFNDPCDDTNKYLEVNYICAECFDTYKDDCPRWASQGECTNNPSWMTAFCKKSCWGCGLENTCTNSITEPSCDCMATQGQCSTNADYMSTRCQYSCNMCNQAAPCVNSLGNDTECNIYARIGECTGNPKWMEVNCQKACNVCAEVPASGAETTTSPQVQTTSISSSTFSTLPPSTAMPTFTTMSKTKPSSPTVTMPTATPTAIPSTTAMPTSSPSPTSTTTPISTIIPTSPTKITSTSEASSMTMPSSTKMPTSTAKPTSSTRMPTTTRMPSSTRMSTTTRMPPTTMSTTTTSTTRTTTVPTISTAESTLSSSTLTTTTVAIVDLFPDAECINRHVDCDYWAETQQCTLNPEYMLENCRPACKICQLTTDEPSSTTTVPTSTTAAPTSTTTAPSSTTTTQTSTPTAQTSTTTSTTTRSTTTTASTSTTSTARSTISTLPDRCVNLFNDHQCGLWAKLGQCINDTDWMMRNCYKACYDCSPVSTTDTMVTPSTPGTQPCVNVYRNEERCNQWAAAGLCEIDRVWMRTNCYKSCQNCDQESETSTNRPPTTETSTTTQRSTSTETGCGDLEGEVICQLWRRANQCNTSPDYMRRNCARSCGYCTVTTQETFTRRPPTTTTTMATTTTLPPSTTKTGEASCLAVCANGRCTTLGECVCSPGWTGLRCDRFRCDSGCGVHGTCVGPNVCECEKGWIGRTCDEPICESGCSGKGICTAPNRCLCYPYWTGDDCSECGVKGVGKACLPCPPCEHGTCVSDGENTVRTYIGCFADPSQNDLEYLAWRGQATTTWMCVQECHRLKYRYAGTQNGNECYCGNIYGRSGASASCTVGCMGGKPREICGGFRANSIYKVQDGVCQCDSFYGGRLCNRCSEGFTGPDCRRRVIVQPPVVPNTPTPTTSTTKRTTTTTTTRPTTTTTTPTTTPQPTTIKTTTRTTSPPPTPTPTTRAPTTTTMPTTTMTQKTTTRSTTRIKIPQTETSTTTTTTKPITSPQTTTSTPKPTTKQVENEIPVDIGPVRGLTGIGYLDLTIVLPSVQWSNAYADRDSPMSKGLIRDVEIDLNRLYDSQVVRNVEILRLRNGSVVVDYRVNFKTEVGDKYAVVMECYLSDRERKRLDTLSVDYEIPKEIEQTCLERGKRCMNGGDLRRSQDGRHYCTCRGDFSGEMCENNIRKSTETIVIAVVGAFLPFLGLILFCCTVFVRKRRRSNGDSKTNLVQGYDTGTVSFQYQDMDGTKSSRPTSTHSAADKKEIAEYAEEFVNIPNNLG